MRKLILGAALLAIAGPVAAQSYDGRDYDDRGSYGYSQRYDDDGDRDQYRRDDRSYDNSYDDRGYERQRFPNLTVGYGVPQRFAERATWIVNPWKVGLPPAPRFAHWLVARGVAVLVRNRDRVVLRVVRFG